MKTRIPSSLMAIFIVGWVTTSAQEVSIIQFTGPTLTVGEDQSEMVVFVTRTGNRDATVTIDYATRDGTALAGEDYVPASGTLAFAPGDLWKTFSLVILNDGRTEGSELFTVALSQPGAGAQLGPVATMSVGIQDNDPGVRFEVSTLEVPEDVGTVTLVVQRGNDGAFPFTLDYATSDGTAEAGVDYEAVAGKLSFDIGETTQTIFVRVLNDLWNEFDVFSLESTEDFRIALTNPTAGASLGSPAVVTISVRDNDPGVAFGSDSQTVPEGSASVEVTVWHGYPGDFPFTVDYATGDGSATAGLDYQAVAGTLRFAAGERWKTIGIPILNDGLREADETIILWLSNPTAGAALGDLATMTVAIRDNDPGVSFEWLFWSQGELSQVQEDSTPLTLTVWRGNDVDLPAFTVDYAMSDGTATAGLDYTATSGTLNFAAGQAYQTISIPILKDGVPEQPETFVVFLRNPSAGVGLGSSTVFGVTIHDPDFGEVPPGEYRVSEESGVLTLTVWRTSSEDLPAIQVPYTVEGEARVGEDFLLPDQPLQFAAGALTATLRIPILDDSKDEGDEVFFLSLPPSVRADYENPFRILDNDPLRWEQRHEFPASGLFLGVGYGAGKFVAVGGRWNASDDAIHVLATSTDGLNWTKQRLPAADYRLADVAYGNQRFVAVGAGSDGGDVVLSSTNAEDWRVTANLDLDPELSQQESRILFGNGRFVAWTGRWGWAAGPIFIFTSVDGVDWAATALPAEVRDITFGNGLFVAVGDGGVFSSPDAKTWTKQRLPAELWLTAVAFGDGTFLAVSGYPEDQKEARFLTSPDGVVWTEPTFSRFEHPGFWQFAQAVAYFDGRFIVFGHHDAAAGPNLQLKREGDLWTMEPVDGPDVMDVAAGNGSLVGVATTHAFAPSGLLYASSDGRNWATPNAWLSELAYGHERFVASAGWGAFTSSNGRDWTLEASPGAIGSVGFAHGLFVALASRRSTWPDWSPDAQILTSPDAQSWSLRASQQGLGWVSSLAVGDERFVALGNLMAAGLSRLQALTSTDGVNWTASPLPEGLQVGYGSIAYGNGYFVVPAFGGDSRKLVLLRSKDGTDWKAIPFTWAQDAWSLGIVFGNQLFLTWTGSGTPPKLSLWTSTDGAEWTAQPSRFDVGILDIAAGGGLFVAVVQDTDWEWGEANKVLVSRQGFCFLSRERAFGEQIQATT